MKSKWEWIADACRKLGYEEAAGIADEIETVLKEIYGDTKTIAWMKDYIDVKEEELNFKTIWIVAGDMPYCIACMEEELCEECRFRKRCGGCEEDESLYTLFCNTLYREAMLQ